MIFKDIARLRLISQQIAGTRFETAKQMAAWMGALQAQDYVMAKWALGVRLPNATDQIIETAINRGEIIRTHLLRPTWHFVSVDDIRWMLALTAPHILAALKSRHEALGITDEVAAMSNAVIEKVVGAAGRLTREELTVELKKAGYSPEDNRMSHLLLRAEMEGIVCSGAVKNGKLTYALLEERVPQKNTLTREEALAVLAKRYFSSHGPATLQDFTWWSGLPVGDAKDALESVKAALSSATIAGQTYWFAGSGSIPGDGKETVALLPAYDELIISYKDRSAALPAEYQNKSVSNNGVFWPMIVVNGQVKGVWKRTIKSDRMIVEIEFFEKPDEIIRGLVEKASVQYGRFVGKEVEVRHTF